jgi:hypothetical protein
MENEIRYFTRIDMLKMVIAAHPKTGAAVVFNEKEKKWVVAPQNYFQISCDSYFERISKEQAQEIFQDILPDDLLNDIDKYIVRKPDNQQPFDTNKGQ